jgi:hypothetical protein
MKFPWHFDRHSKDLCKKLLTADLTKRLGSLKGGAEDIKKHKWYSAGTPPMDWDALYNGQYGEAPVQPDVKDDADTSNFDDYPDSVEGSTQSIDAKDQAVFDDF